MSLLFLTLTIGLNLIQALPPRDYLGYDPTKFMPVHNVRGGHDYYVSLQAMGQKEAMVECAKRPSYQLAMVTSSLDTQEIVHELSFQDVDYVWTSGQTKGPLVEHGFHWLTNGETITGYTNWGEGQPSLDHIGDWVKSSIVLSQDGKWGLNNENTLRRALCQKRRY